MHAHDAHPVVLELYALPAEYPGAWNISSDCTFLLGCRRIEQFFGTLRSILDPERFCLFCHPELMAAQPIMEEAGWLAKRNDFPYPHHEHHFVLFPKRHVTGGHELTDRDHIAKGRLERRLMRQFNFDGFVSVMRQGDARRTVATVPHVHSHVQVPSGEGPATAYLGKTPEHAREDFARLKTQVEELVRRGGLPWLMDPATRI